LGTYSEIFHEDDIIIVTSHVHKTQSVQYFAHSFTTCQVLNTIVLNTIASYEYQKHECFQK